MKSVPTVMTPLFPCSTAIQRPTAAVRQKSVAEPPAKPAGFMTNGAPGVVEIEASYFVASADSVMFAYPLSVVLIAASGSAGLAGVVVVRVRVHRTHRLGDVLLCRSLVRAILKAEVGRQRNRQEDPEDQHDDRELDEREALLAFEAALQTRDEVA